MKDIDSQAIKIDIKPIEVAKIRKLNIFNGNLYKDYKGFFTEKTCYKYLNFLIY